MPNFLYDSLNAPPGHRSSGSTFHKAIARSQAGFAGTALADDTRPVRTHGGSPIGLWCGSPIVDGGEEAPLDSYRPYAEIVHHETTLDLPGLSDRDASGALSADLWLLPLGL